MELLAKINSNMIDRRVSPYGGQIPESGIQIP
jgi:hypothetical protein